MATIGKKEKIHDSVPFHFTMMMLVATVMAIGASALTGTFVDATDWYGPEETPVMVSEFASLAKFLGIFGMTTTALSFAGAFASHALRSRLG